MPVTAAEAAAVAALAVVNANAAAAAILEAPWAASLAQDAIGGAF